MIHQWTSENVMNRTTNGIGDEIHGFMWLFKSERNLYLKPYFYDMPNICKYRELFTLTNETRLINLSKNVGIIMFFFFVDCFPNGGNKMYSYSYDRLILIVNFLPFVDFEYIIHTLCYSALYYCIIHIFVFWMLCMWRSLTPPEMYSYQ